MPDLRKMIRVSLLLDCMVAVLVATGVGQPVATPAPTGTPKVWAHVSEISGSFLPKVVTLPERQSQCSFVFRPSWVRIRNPVPSKRLFFGLNTRN
jgi:hypothetical protein